MHVHPIRRFFRRCAAALCLTLAACQVEVSAPAWSTAPVPGQEATIYDYPRYPSGDPPGADAFTLATARALGRGVNFGDMLESPAPVEWVRQVRDEYIAAARAAGFATVRLPVRWGYHALTRPPYTIDPAFFDLVDSMVDTLLGAGFYVVLDLHHYRQLNGAAPDPGEAAVDASRVEVRYLELWRQIARRYADRSPRLLFELLNEPDGQLNAARWNDLQLRAVQLVRRSNPERILLLAPPASNTALESLLLPDDPRVIATIHHYEPFTFTHQGAEWVAGSDAWLGTACCDAEQTRQIVEPLERARTWSRIRGYPVYLGEFGAYGRADLGSRVNFTRLMRESAETRGLSWAYWEFASGFGVYEPRTGTWRQPLLDALFR